MWSWLTPAAFGVALVLLALLSYGGGRLVGQTLFDAGAGAAGVGYGLLAAVWLRWIRRRMPPDHADRGPPRARTYRRRPRAP